MPVSPSIPAIFAGTPVEFPVSDCGRVHQDSETGATGLLKPEASRAGSASRFARVVFARNRPVRQPQGKLFDVAQGRLAGMRLA
jgi:hypothetical protein